MNECPHCGSPCGYYIKIRVSGVLQWHYKWDGSESDNIEAYDSMSHKDYKTKYCQECEKPVKPEAPTGKEVK